MVRFTDQDLHRIAEANGTPLGFPPPKRRKKRSNEESRSQQALIRWWDAICRSHGLWPQHLFSIPNGGWRDPVGASILRREGLRPGICDLFLAHPRGSYCGLFIEMKAEGGTPSDEQEQFIKLMRAEGYLVDVCYSYDEAANLITGYLKL